MLFVACESKLDAPSGLQGRQMGNTIVLAWNMVEGATAYEIHGSWGYKQAYTTNFTDVDPQPGYNSYEICAYNGNARSKYVSINVFYDEGNSSSENGGGTNQNSVVYNQLLGTKWEMVSNYEDGVAQNDYVQLSFIENQALGFSHIVFNEVIYGECKWWTKGNDSLFIDGFPIVNYTKYSNAYVAGLNVFFSGSYKIIYLTNTEMRLHLYSAITNGTRDITYRKLSGSSGEGGGSSQGVTSLYLSDYTEWPTKIKVVYKYESDAKVTSAKIYYGEYGTNNSVNATVSSATITAYINGLKKNTVYYVKASATTSKGTVYSEESCVMTAIE